LGWYCGGMADYVDVFEEAGLLQEFIGVLDYVDSTLAAVERCRPPSVIARTLVYDGSGCSTTSPGNTVDTLAR